MYNMTIAENIRRIRREKHMTQKQLGDLCGMDEANYRKYELGKINPRIETAEKIAEALGVNLLELLDLQTGSCIGKQDDAEMKQESSSETDDRLYAKQGRYVNDTAELELLKSFRKLNAVGQREARKRVGELTEIPRYRYTRR